MSVERATPLESLLLKLDGWLRQQPEWPALFTADRRTRRRAAQALAQALYRLPSAPVSEQLNRQARRAVVREVRRLMEKEET